MEVARNCAVCGIDISDKKEGAKTCSPKCRKELSRLESVTHNVTLSDTSVTPEVWFEFTVRYNRKPGDAGYDSDIAAARKKVRTAKYWYDVPLAAVPILKKGWPEVPEFETKFGPEPMNGRQYFLWWKNDFDTKDGKPIIYSPFPPKDNLTYAMGGEGSRRWGA